MSRLSAERPMAGSVERVALAGGLGGMALLINGQGSIDIGSTALATQAEFVGSLLEFLVQPCGHGVTP